jgi:hypothetical protein
MVTGHQAPHHVGELCALLEQFPELKSRITNATHLRSTRWDIKLDGKVYKKGSTDSIEYAHFVWQKGHKTEFTKTYLI